MSTPHRQPNGTATYPPPLASTINPVYMPGGSRSLSGISLRAFLLGMVLGSSIVLTIVLAWSEQYMWRAPCFIAILAMFHYLEFNMTARFNPPDARISSFLLSSNGVAYNAAHTCALIEVLFRALLNSPSLRPQWLSLPFTMPITLPTFPVEAQIGIGILMIVFGQYLRSAAMATAGTSFNHLVQSTKKDDHVLVTSGVYSFSRHPSYLGFFCWGVGTQVLLGNQICLLGYIVALWNFFSARIQSEYLHSLLLQSLTPCIEEELFLVQFFGQEYLDYREKTPVRIPFIR